MYINCLDKTKVILLIVTTRTRKPPINISIIIISIALCNAYQA